MEQPDKLNKAYARDLSSGLEPVPIVASGFTTDDFERLKGFERLYVVDSVIPDGTPILLHPQPNDILLEDTSEDSDNDDVTGCGCSPRSGQLWSCTREDGGSCDCVGEYGNFYSKPDAGAKEEQSLNLDALPERWPLVECYPACPCQETCANRLTQQGVRVSVAVRPVPQAGFGLFYSPTEPNLLPRGTFISLYAGEYLSTPEARLRWSSASDRAVPGAGNYILTLRLPDSTLHIDPRRIGNVGRFLNHSCEPNCVIQVVRWGAGSWPRAAIFTQREIDPGEELTFDYGNASGSAPSDREDVVREAAETGNEAGRGRTKCFCGTLRCRGWMPFDETL